jgi:hypothetical protein
MTVSASPLTGCTPSPDGKTRAALVIGNFDYTTATILPTPQNDANKIATTLCKTEGFTYVDLRFNLRTKNDFASALGAFSQAVDHLKPVVSVVYYSGHGMQAQGTNYLIPTHASMQTVAQIQANGILLSDVISDMGAADMNRTRIVIIDACRDNPNNLVVPGPVPLKGFVHENLIVAYAGPDGQSVDNNMEGLSPYTWSLLQALPYSKLDVVATHALTARILFDLTLKETEGTDIQLADIGGQIHHGEYHYTSPAISAPLGVEDTIVQNVSANAWASSSAKSVQSHVPVDGLSTDELLRRAQTALHRRAMRNGSFATDPYGFPLFVPNFAAAARYWEAAAKDGSASAMRRLGDLLVAGRGVKRDYGRAYSLFKAAADKGDLYAMERMGDSYRDGIGIQKNNAQAVAWYSKALQLGHQEANADLGYMAFTGRDVTGKPNHQAALTYFRAAANAGVPEAHAWLGFLYLDTNPAAARAEFLRADAVGDVAGMENLSSLYGDDTPGVPKSRELSTKYFYKALAYVDQWYITEYSLDKD